VTPNNRLRPAQDILFWDQVIKADQFFLPALWPLTRWLSGGRIFLFFGLLTSAAYYQYLCQAFFRVE